MSKVLVTESYLEDIGDAIRIKSDSEDTYTPAEMANAILNIPGGSHVISKLVHTTVSGGYNGGAVITITIDEDVVFTATAYDTYNRNYDKTHEVIYITTFPVIIDITPPATNTGALGISIKGNNTIEYSVMPSGVNTSYGYNFSAEDTLTVGGNDVPIIPEEDWEAMTTAEKQAYGLIIIQTATTGFERGIYVNGADYSAI